MIGRRRHRHHWRVVAERFEPPQDFTIEGRGPSVGRMVEICVRGVTVTMLRCSECGKIDREEMIGDCRVGIDA